MDTQEAAMQIAHKIAQIRVLLREATSLADEFNVPFSLDGPSIPEFMLASYKPAYEERWEASTGCEWEQSDYVEYYEGKWTSDNYYWNSSSADC